jgi:hypothetical protein
MSLQFNGRPVRWLGLGAPADIGAGISALSAAASQDAPGNFRGAVVSAMKAAGTAAVTQVGPAIDALSGSDPAVMQLTHRAWELNDRLTRVDSSDVAGPTDVDSARGIVNQMVDAYQQAAKLAASRGAQAPRPGATAPRPGSAPLPVTTAPTDNGSKDNTVTWVAVGVGAFVLVLGGAALAAAATRAR